MESLLLYEVEIDTPHDINGKKYFCFRNAKHIIEKLAEKYGNFWSSVYEVENDGSCIIGKSISKDEKAFYIAAHFIDMVYHVDCVSMNKIPFSTSEYGTLYRELINRLCEIQECFSQ